MPKLWLGTAQFGLNYGVSNATGKVPADEVEKILNRASELGVEGLDTAPAYGTSEELLGELGAPRKFQIVTKTPQLKYDVLTAEHGSIIRQSLDASLDKLKTDHVHGLLIHWSRDLLAPGGDHIYCALDALKADGSVGGIGVSVYEPDELFIIFSRYEIDFVQFPLNIFDQRFLRPDVTDACRKARVSIHSRSSFLQGLLLMSPEALANRVVHARSRLAEFRNAARAVDRTPLELCLAFVASVSVLDAVVCGVAGLDELDEIAAAFGRPLNCKFDAARFATDDLDVVDPRRW